MLQSNYRLSIVRARKSIHVLANQRDIHTSRPYETTKKHYLSTNSSNEESIAKMLQKERAALKTEAKYMTLALWRTCLRCIKIIRLGNENDEMEFQKREQDRLNNLMNRKSSMSFEMQMPVDRDDELSSRANYYYQWTLENILQERDCLDRDPWMEKDVERFITLLRTGEEKRKWLLKDYKFENPFVQSYDHQQMDNFETRAMEYLKQIYKMKGWPMKSDFMNNDEEYDDSEDDFFDDDKFDIKKK